MHSSTINKKERIKRQIFCGDKARSSKDWQEQTVCDCMSIIGFIYYIQIKSSRHFSMDPHRLSQTTLPSTHHSLTSQQQPNTDTSVHNNALSHQHSPNHGQSFPGDNNHSHQSQPLQVAHRTNSQRIPEPQKEREDLGLEGNKLCKSQGQRSAPVIIEQNRQQGREQKQQQAGKISASWGGQNLLQGQSQSSNNHQAQKASVDIQPQKSQKNLSKAAQYSQTSENLLDFSYPIDQAYTFQFKAANNIAILQERCESQSKIKNIPQKAKQVSIGIQVDMQMQNKNMQKVMEIQVKSLQFSQQQSNNKAEDNHMEIQDINELRRRVQQNRQQIQKLDPQKNSKQQVYSIREVQNKPYSMHSIDRSEVYNSSEAVQLDSEYLKSHQFQFKSNQQSPKHTNTKQQQNCLKSGPSDKKSPIDKLASNSSKLSSQQYEIQVREVNDQRINSHIKNNDIYGIQGKDKDQHQIQEKNVVNQVNKQLVENNIKEHQGQTIIQKKYTHSEGKEDRAVLGGYYDASEGSNLSKTDADNSKPQELSKEIQSTFHLNETKPTEYSQQHHIDQSFPQKIQQPQPYTNLQESHPPTLENILETISTLIQDNRQSEVRFLQFKQLIYPHIDLMFMKALDNIGEAIFSDGQNAVMFCKLYSLKEEPQQNRNAFERYLISIITQKIKTNNYKFQEYRTKFYPERRSRIVQAHSEKIEGKVPQEIREDQSQLRPNPAKLKIEEPSETQSILNLSLQINAPSAREDAYSILKQHLKPSAITQPKTQAPIRRQNLDVSDLQLPGKAQNVNMSVQPKRTLKARPSQKVRIISNSKQTNKSISKKFMITQQKKLPLQLKRLGISYNKDPSKKGKKSNGKQLEDQQEQHLGSGYTFLQTRINDHAYLQPVRASHRIQVLYKHKNPPPNHKAKSSRKSQKVNIASVPPKQNQTPPKNQTRSKKNRSSRKTNDFLGQSTEQQYLNVDQIKNYFRQISIQLPSEFQNIQNFTPISKQDSYIADLLFQYKQLNRAEQDLQRDYQKSQSAFEGTHDLQELEEITMTNRRIQENQSVIAGKKKQVKQKIQEYYKTPIEVARIVDPNINNHGIYALLELTKKSALVFKARYFVTQISCIQYAPRKFIDQDLKTIRSLVEEEQQDNIGSIALNENILSLIQKQKLLKEQINENQ